MVCESFGGGVFAYVTQLCNAMCDEFNIYLAYGLRPQTPSNFRELLDSRVKLFEVSGFSKLKRINKTIRFLRRIEEDIKPDIIHLHSSIAGGIGRIAFKKRKESVIYTPHGFAHILLGGGFKSWLYKRFEKILGNKALTLTCCKSEDEEAKKFSKRTAFIETGMDIEEFDKVLKNVKLAPKKEFTVFTLGRICTQKQPKLFNQIAEMTPDVKFVWIGDGELKHELKAPNIRVTGWLSRMDALALAKQADVFILCSLGEAIAMSLLENMYLKKLCLVSNVIGNRSVIIHDKNGYVCENAEDYSNHIKNSTLVYPFDKVENAFADILNVYNTTAMRKKYIDFYTTFNG